MTACYSGRMRWIALFVAVGLTACFEDPTGATVSDDDAGARGTTEDPTSSTTEDATTGEPTDDTSTSGGSTTGTTGSDSVGVTTQGATTIGGSTGTTGGADSTGPGPNPLAACEMEGFAFAVPPSSKGSWHVCYATNDIDQATFVGFVLDQVAFTKGVESQDPVCGDVTNGETYIWGLAMGSIAPGSHELAFHYGIGAADAGTEVAACSFELSEP